MSPRFVFAALMLMLPSECSLAAPTAAPASCAILHNVQGSWGLVGFTAAYADRAGQIVEFAVGKGADGRPIRPGDKFLSGSIGKTFVAALALDLERRRASALDARIWQILKNESWFAGLPNSDEFTLRQLLTHTSGLPSHVDDERFRRAISDRIRRCPRCEFTPIEAIRYVAGKPPLFRPGRGWAYSETGYLVAGKAIERATGHTYYELLRERILLPLGLNETVPSDRNNIARIVAGRISGQDNYFGMVPLITTASGRLRYNPAFEWTGGGVAASSRDLARWAHLLYSGAAFKGAYLQELLSSVPSEDGDRYGLGVEITGHGSGLSYGHTGSIPGYASVMRYYPVSGESIAFQVAQDVHRSGSSNSFAKSALEAGRLGGLRRRSQAVFCN